MKNLIIALIFILMGLTSCSPEVYQWKHHVLQPNTAAQEVHDKSGVIKIYKKKIVIKSDDKSYSRTIKYPLRPDREIINLEKEYQIRVWDNSECIFFINQEDIPFGCLLCNERKSEFFYFEHPSQWTPLQPEPTSTGSSVN
jgi:hypothetical protein